MARIYVGAPGKIMADHRGDDRHKRSYLMRAAPREAGSDQLKRWSSPVMDAVALIALLLSFAVVLGVLFEPLERKLAGSVSHIEKAAFTSSAQGRMRCANDTSPALLVDRSRTTHDQCKGIVDDHRAQPVVHRTSDEPGRSP